MNINCPNCNQSLEVEEEMNGMTVDCPSCDSPFVIELQIEEPEIPQTKNCQFCGEEVLAIAKKCKHCGEFFEKSSNVSEKSRSSASNSKGAEKTIWEGHTSHLYFLGDHILGVILWVIAIGFIINIVAYFKAKNKKYKVTNKRIISESGVLSKNVAEVAIKDIRSVNLKQGIFERMFNLGTVEVGTAGTAGIEVSLQGIENAPMVKYQISKLKSELD